MRWCPSCDRWCPLPEMARWPLSRHVYVGFRTALVWAYGGWACRRCSDGVMALANELRTA